MTAVLTAAPAWTARDFDRANICTVASERPTAGLYTRLSRAQGDEKVATCAVQESALRAEAERRELDVVAVFVDDGISAFSGRERPGFVALCDAIDAGDVRYVLAVEMSRFSRDDVEAAIFRRDCRDAGVTIIAEGREYGPEDDAGALISQIESWSAWSESRKKSRRVRRAKVEAAQLGRYNGGRHRPFGFVPGPTPGTLETEPTEAAALREGVAMLTAGQSLRAVARKWNEQGLRTTGMGRLWTHGQVRLSVGRPAITGVRMHNGVAVGPASWPGIITPAEQRRALAALQSRYQHPRSRQGRAPALLSGVIVCGRCGMPMTPRRYSKRSDNYTCQADGGERCGRTGIHLERTDTLVAARLVARITEPAYIEALAARDTEANSAVEAELVAEIACLEADLEALADDYGRGDLNRTEWKTARAGLSERLDEARTALLNAQPTPPPAMLTGGAEAWNALTLDEQRAIVLSHIEQVTVAPATHRGGPFEPSRVSVSWRS